MSQVKIPRSAIAVSVAAAGTTTTDAGLLQSGSFAVFRTSAADDTKGVRLHADYDHTGVVVEIANGVSNKILKVYPPTGGAINGAAANAAFSSVSGAGVRLVCLSPGVWAGR